MIHVGIVSEADTDGMVTIDGRRGSGAQCRLRVAEDWPVQHWTAELAALENYVTSTEHRRLFGGAEQH